MRRVSAYRNTSQYTTGYQPGPAVAAAAVETAGFRSANGSSSSPAIVSRLADSWAPSGVVSFLGHL